MDKQIGELAKGAASKVGKKKFRYMGNPDITMCGRMLVVYKMMLDCKSRNTPNVSVDKASGSAECGFDKLQYVTPSRPEERSM